MCAACCLWVVVCSFLLFVVVVRWRFVSCLLVVESCLLLLCGMRCLNVCRLLFMGCRLFFFVWCLSLIVQSRLKLRNWLSFGACWMYFVDVRCLVIVV